MPNDSIEKLAVISTTETTAWILNNTFAPLVLEAAQAHRLLAGLAAASETDHQAGTGDTVKVRLFPKRTAQKNVAEGAALTENASTPTSYSLQMKKHGDHATLTGEAILFTSDNVRARLLSAMGRGLARAYDEIVYDEIKGATPGSSKLLDAHGDLVTNSDFAVKVMALVDEMRAAKDVIPDVIICGPDQINALASIKTTDLQVGANIRLGPDGRPSHFYGLRIIDLFSIANRNANTASLVQAVVVDTSRAWGEIHGKLPTMEEERVAKSDKWEYVTWGWFNAADLDTDGIGHIKNPA